MNDQPEQTKLLSLREHLSRIGKAKGVSKKRGDSDYYRQLRQKRAKNKTSEVVAEEW
jgi:hypothetical protein